MAQPTTSRLIAAAARDLLRPLGLVQKGRSRTWLGDQAWWLLGVSFAHSGFGKASYLNVFVTWLWNDRDDLTFDVGGRTRWISTTGSDKGGISFESAEQFSREARRMVEAATTQVDLYRAMFVTVHDCAEYYAGQEVVPVEQYPNAGIANGLVGRSAEAERWFDAFLARDDPREWAVARRDEVRALKDLLKRDADEFRTRSWSLIDQKRARFKLPELPAAARTAALR
jgi:hypothetical protein